MTIDERTSLEMLWDVIDEISDRGDTMQAAFLHGVAESLYSDNREHTYEGPEARAFDAGFESARPFNVMAGYEAAAEAAAERYAVDEKPV